jgi:OOP family OmpA-OmpF porin
MQRVWIVVVTCVVLSVPAAHAGRFYVGLGAGSSNAELSAETRIDFDSTGYQGFVGYEIMRYFGVEVGYTDFGDLDETIGTQQYTGDASNLAVWGIGILPVTPRLSLYGRLGYAAYDSEISAQDGMATPVTTKNDGNDLAWGFGVSYYFTRRVGMRLELENYRFEASDEVTFTSLDVLFKF